MNSATTLMASHNTEGPLVVVAAGDELGCAEAGAATLKRIMNDVLASGDLARLSALAELMRGYLEELHGALPSLAANTP
jgi:hypothetical protein